MNFNTNWIHDLRARKRLYSVPQLSEEQAAVLEKELAAIIEGDCYFLSPRIQTLREIRAAV
jgi:hypothetical protein